MRVGLLDKAPREFTLTLRFKNAALPPVDRAAAAGELVIRLEVDSALPGGLAIYGRRFGQYPLGPTLVFVSKP
ncbi:MAG: hypothetical protein AUG74_17485 [Bacteroidetes bacterium 13_1_20CM_4_60_6]|nr:MAG: hypothetical protein AUG74_17485 [Bacteroidetes bacterium 13_1_20CM_4_60_6]